MRENVLFKALEVLKTGDSAQRKDATKLIFKSVDSWDDKFVTELFSLLENENCRDDVETILFGTAEEVWFYGHYKKWPSSQARLIELLENDGLRITVMRLLSIYFRYKNGKCKYSLSSEAEVALVSLLLKSNCPDEIKNFFWAYIETYRVATWNVQCFRNLSVPALSKIVDSLDNENYRDVAQELLLRYFDHCWRDESHYLHPQHEVKLVKLLKNADCRDMVKNIFLKYIRRTSIQLSDSAERGLILLLLRNKDCRNVAKELILEYTNNAGLTYNGHMYLKSILRIVDLWGFPKYKKEMDNFYIKLEAAC